MGAVTIGMDVGQRVDPTAIAVVEQEARQGTAPDTRELHHLVRHLERLPLGTPYPAVAERLVAIVRAVHERTRQQPALYLDATGVGQPLVDMLTAAGVKATVRPCYFTHGDRRSQERGEVRIGKAWLVSRLQVLLQSGRLHLPRMAEADALARELLDYEIRVSEDANDAYGAFKVGTHDDLVTALGLACQVDMADPTGWLPVSIPKSGLPNPYRQLSPRF